MPGKDRVPVTHNRERKPMKANNAFEESLDDGRGSVGLAERDEVSVLGEAIDHSEDDGLAADLGQPLDEIH